MPLIRKVALFTIKVLFVILLIYIGIRIPLLWKNMKLVYFSKERAKLDYVPNEKTFIHIKCDDKLIKTNFSKLCLPNNKITSSEINFLGNIVLKGENFSITLIYPRSFEYSKFQKNLLGLSLTKFEFVDRSVNRLIKEMSEVKLNEMNFYQYSTLHPYLFNKEMLTVTPKSFIELLITPNKELKYYTDLLELKESNFQCSECFFFKVPETKVVGICKTFYENDKVRTVVKLWDMEFLLQQDIIILFDKEADSGLIRDIFASYKFTSENIPDRESIKILQLPNVTISDPNGGLRFGEN